jgi:hypothetical protein
LLNSTASACTGIPTSVLSSAPFFAMGDLFSLSILQILSVLSFFTSVLAVVRVGSGSLYRLSHKFEAHLNQQTPEMNVVSDAKAPLWNWSLGGSLSIGSLIGEDEEEELGKDRRYTGGSDLVRMDWQVARSISSTSRPHYCQPWPADLFSCSLLVQLPPQYSQPPISMAKLIMSRHVSRYFQLHFIVPLLTATSFLVTTETKQTAAALFGGN